jgi:cyclase
MLKKRIIISLTFKDGILFRTKNFIPDYRYTKNFVDFWSIDELILIDISKKKFQKTFLNIINFFSNNCFVPISVGGGISSIKDADLYFSHGADKVILSSKTIENNEVLKDISKKYGNQSIIQSIDYKKSKNKYFLYINSGKKKLNVSPEEWAKKSISYGAGEILLNSIDNDGGLLGYEITFINRLSKQLSCPVLVLGGCGSWEHISELFIKTSAAAACTQNIYHFTNDSIKSAKNFLQKKKIKIRI